MSVEELAVSIERVLASWPEPALHEAITRIEDARDVLAQIGQGSELGELSAAVEGFSQTVEAIASLQQVRERLADVLRAYLMNLGVTAAPVPGQQVRPRPIEAPRSQMLAPTPDPALIAEVQRQGHKLSPDRVVRVARTHDDRVVWLEEGDERSGLRHIMEAKRVFDFERAGIAKDKIVDVVFDALVKGRIAGFIGVDRPVYEVELDGRMRRIAITTGVNGYIVGANPVSKRTRLKESP